MKQIQEAIMQALGQLGYLDVSFVVEHPKDEAMGDYASNIAMVLAKQVDKNPRAIAEEIATSLRDNKDVLQVVEKIEVAGAGFINFTLKQEWLLAAVQQVNVAGDKYGHNENLAGKKVIVEYTDPNPFKEFHIGHLMSNTIGESLARLKISEGAEVRRANYQGDVGLHVAKSIWGMQKRMVEEKQTLSEIADWELTKRQKWMGAAYAYGATSYEDPTLSTTTLGARAEIDALNKTIYDGSDSTVMELYNLGREWSLAYFETIYSRLGTRFDEYFFESETGRVGLEVVLEGLAKGVLELGDEGAVVYRGEKDGLHTRVFRNKLGLPTYEAKDLGLAKAKFGRYPYDLSIVVTANEITEYFRVILSVMSKLYPDLADKTVHKPHGMMKLPTGKMSSRTGKVIAGEVLLNELRDVVLAKMEVRDIANKEVVSDMVAVAALKYSVLKQAVGGDIVYDPAGMTNLEGDTGPYIQYAYARIQSIIRKSRPKADQPMAEVGKPILEPEEVALLRFIYRYPEIVTKAASEFAPHLICTYLADLSGRFNSFYGNCRIADAPEEVRSLRLEMSLAVAQIIKNGLWILGISSPQEM